MPSIGETLRQERLRLGLSLEEVADRTRINARFLEAIEAEEWGRLPGRFFARSFARQYASTLGVDASLFQAELAKLEGGAAPEPLEPRTEIRRFPVPPVISKAKARRLALRRWAGSVAVLVAVVLACAVLYAVWQKARGTYVPGREPASAAPAAAPPSAPGAPRAPIILETRASEETWLRVTADGTVLFSGILQPGQTRTFEGEGAVNVVTGNAGGLEIAFNGKPLGAMGPPGHIRVIEFTPSDHRILERKPPPASEPAPDEAARGASGA